MNIPTDEKIMKSLLKSNTTKTSSEGRLIKNVSFADSKGQNLVDVHNFVPSSENLFRYESLDNFNGNSINVQASVGEKPTGLKWITYFSDYDTISEHFFKELNERKVILECLSVGESDGNGTQYIRGFIRVLNIAFEKKVYIRGSFQNWLTYFEVEAMHHTHYPETNTDIFSFVFPLRSDFSNISKTMEFAIAFQVDHTTYWDNNNSLNYRAFQI